MSNKNSDPWKSIKHFKPTDFKCSCGKCNGTPMNIDVVRKLDEIREKIGLPFRIMYGAVCPHAGTKGPRDFPVEHFPDPETGECYSVDIKCPSQGEAPTFRYQFLKAAIEVGFKKIGLGRAHIHVDDHPGSKNETVWLRW